MNAVGFSTATDSAIVKYGSARAAVSAAMYRRVESPEERRAEVAKADAALDVARARMNRRVNELHDVVREALTLRDAGVLAAPSFEALNRALQRVLEAK